jgi:serine/threonine protein kinase
MWQYELHAGRAPFQSYDPTSTAKKILQARINFPSKFSRVTQTVIKSLLTKDPTRRLGCMNDGTDGVTKHRFYTGFDWQGLLDKNIKPPYTPKVPAKIENLGKFDSNREKFQSCEWTPKLE